MSAPDITREQWLAMKRSPIITLGASSAAAACGLGHYESPFALFHRLRGNVEPDDLTGNDYVHFGNVLEPIVLSEFARRCSRRLLDPVTDRDLIERLIEQDGASKVLGWVEGRQAFVASVARPWQVATLDGVAITEAVERGEFEIVEAKTGNEYTASAWNGEDEAPDDYRLQAIHQLAVVPSAARNWLAAVIGGNKFRAVEVQRDPSQIENLCAVEAAFMADVAAGIEPVADGSESSLATLKKLHPDDTGATIVLPVEALEIHEELESIKTELEKLAEPLEERQKELKNRLRQIIGAATFGELPNGAGSYSLKTTEVAPFMNSGSKYRTLRFARPKSKSRKSRS